IRRLSGCGLWCESFRRDVKGQRTRPYSSEAGGYQVRETAEVGGRGAAADAWPWSGWLQIGQVVVVPLVVVEELVDVIVGSDEVDVLLVVRSEERRVGKECRSRW